MRNRGYASEPRLLADTGSEFIHLIPTSFTSKVIIYQSLSGGFTLIIEDGCSLGMFTRFFKDIAELDDYLLCIGTGDVFMFDKSPENSGDFIFIYRKSLLAALSKVMGIKPQVEESSKQKLKPVYDNPVWANFYKGIDKIAAQSLAVKESKEEKQPSKPTPEKEVEVTVDNKYYGRCPECGELFNYSKDDDGKLVRCRDCSLPMRLRLRVPEEEK